MHFSPLAVFDRAPDTAPMPSAEAERIARASLSLFLDAIGVPGATSNSLAVALFAHGAVDGIAARCGDLDGRAHRRLERVLLAKLADSRRRGISGWRRTLRDLETTARGRGLRRCGEQAVHGWLAGEPPLPSLKKALDDPLA